MNQDNAEVLDAKFIDALKDRIIAGPRPVEEDRAKDTNLFGDIASRIRSGNLRCPHIGPLEVLRAWAKTMEPIQDEDSELVDAIENKLRESTFGRNWILWRLYAFSTLTWEERDIGNGVVGYVPVLKVPSHLSIRDAHVLDFIDKYRAMLGWPLYVVVEKFENLIMPGFSRDLVKSLFGQK